MGVRKLLSRASFEMTPTPDVVEVIGAILPTDTIIHIMCPPERGSDFSVSVAIDLVKRGYADVVPHISSRTVKSKSHLRELIQRLRDNGIRRGFFPGGDGATPYGDYSSAVQLLDDLSEMDHGLETIGVACYPQGHRTIPDDVLVDALLHKQKIATHMINEICLEPQQIVAWLKATRDRGVTLPLWLGVPGAMRLSQLVRQIQEWGIKAAISYLKKPSANLGAMASGRFSPKAVIRGIGDYAADPTAGIERAHFFTFNEAELTAAWRQEELRSAEH
jgi:methylenetetrahydrofolate reductase (NADPH)